MPHKLANSPRVSTRGFFCVCESLPRPERFSPRPGLYAGGGRGPRKHPDICPIDKRTNSSIGGQDFSNKFLYL
jgi:hypothetical protein